MTVAQYQAEQFAKQERARWSAIMTHPETKGREELAQTLLGITEPHAMTQDAIIACLVKAPKATAAINDTSTSDDPALAAFGNSPSAPGGIFDPQLLALGEMTARYLLGKPAK
jgi:hypothetical protein